MSKSIQLLNEREVAQILGLSVACLRKRRWERSGPPFIKLGVACRYPYGALLDWLSSQPHTGSDSKARGAKR
jgi:predicted DNA-binding transcriptional regulator AlpA